MRTQEVMLETLAWPSAMTEDGLCTWTCARRSLRVPRVPNNAWLEFFWNWITSYHPSCPHFRPFFAGTYLVICLVRTYTYLLPTYIIINKISHWSSTPKPRAPEPNSMWRPIEVGYHRETGHRILHIIPNDEFFLYPVNESELIEIFRELKNPFGKPQAEVDFACVYNL